MSSGTLSSGPEPALGRRHALGQVGQALGLGVRDAAHPVEVLGDEAAQRVVTGLGLGGLLAGEGGEGLLPGGRLPGEEVVAGPDGPAQGLDDGGERLQRLDPGLHGHEPPVDAIHLGQSGDRLLGGPARRGHPPVDSPA